VWVYRSLGPSEMLCWTLQRQERWKAMMAERLPNIVAALRECPFLGLIRTTTILSRQCRSRTSYCQHCYTFLFLEGITGTPGYLDSFSMSTYQYEGFDKPRDQIRLLTLLPGSADDPVVCTLAEHFLDDLPSYEAVSYTWGSSVVKDTIIIKEDDLLSVPKNTYDALVELRDAEAPRTLWIDAICIEQVDLKEKWDQISIMKTIYSRAAQVVVWFSKPRGDEASVRRLLEAYPSTTPYSQENDDRFWGSLNYPEW